MDRLMRDLKAALDVAILRARVRPGPIHQRFRDLCQNALQPDDDMAVIAAKALQHLCSDDGEFNGDMVALEGVTSFLRTSAAQAPQGPDYRDCLRDLKRTQFTRGPLESWAREWFSF